MKYLGITQKTAGWILSDSKFLNVLKSELKLICQTYALKTGVLSTGPFRICSEKENLLAIWNTEYLSGTGSEEWGFIKLTGEGGILKSDDVGIAFEKSLMIINMRLQGLLLSTKKYKSTRDSNVTVLNKSNIAYKENNVDTNFGRLRSLICVGPIRNNEILEKVTSQEGKNLPKLISTANDLIQSIVKRPTLDVSIYKGISDKFASNKDQKGPVQIAPYLDLKELEQSDIYNSVNLNYQEWISPESTLTPVQRNILDSDILLNQPLRITGAAGSGKTLLMQLLAMRMLKNFQQQRKDVKILYIVHNSEMEFNTWNRFETLGAEEFLVGEDKQILKISTLFGYSKETIEVTEDFIIDKDAYETKIFQRSVITRCLEDVLEKRTKEVKESDLLSQLLEKTYLSEVFSDMIANEIGVAIKGRGFQLERIKYVRSELALSRLHKILNQTEREIIFDVFEKYNEILFEQYGVLDSDDIALSFLGTLRTPLWSMKRKKLGYDFIFVDETQLFNENERTLFRFLSKGNKAHVPIVLALDEAQEIRGHVSAGFGRMGIERLENKSLTIVHRCTESILSLAFHIIQRTTDLFGSEFPDFTSNTITIVEDSHPLASKPVLIKIDKGKSLEKSLLKKIRTLRKKNFRQIGVIVHAEKYWGQIVSYFEQQQLPLEIVTRRGASLEKDKPLVVLSRPESIGGQEFDAVIAVGLEQGVVPPTVHHYALAEAMEQQCLREIYLSFTRAKYQLIVINSVNSSPTKIIKEAIEAKLIIEN